MNAILQRLQPLLDQAQPWMEKIQPWLDTHLPQISTQVLLVWLGLAMLNVAFGACRSWIGMLRMITPLVFALSCAWFWGRFGTRVFTHTWLAAGFGTLALGMLVMFLGLFTRRIARWSVFALLTSPVLWPFQLASALGEIVRFLGLLPAIDVPKKILPDPVPSRELTPLETPAGAYEPAFAQNAPPPFSAPPPSVPDPAVRHAALGIEETMQQLHAPMTYEFVKAADFSHLDLKFYDQTRAALETHLFTHLYDIEITSMRSAMVKPVFIRALRSPDHCVSVAFYHLKGAWWFRLLGLFSSTMRRMLNSKPHDFETEFEDGSFVITTSAEAVANFDYPDHLNSEAFPGRSLEEVGHLHYQRLAAHGTARGTYPVKIHSVQAALDMQQRLHQAKTSARGSQGLSREEFRRITGDASASIDAIYDEWQQVRASKTS
jgi:hypothetical protein